MMNSTVRIQTSFSRPGWSRRGRHENAFASMQVKSCRGCLMHSFIAEAVGGSQRKIKSSKGRAEEYARISEIILDEKPMQYSKYRSGNKSRYEIHRSGSNRCFES